MPPILEHSRKKIQPVSSSIRTSTLLDLLNYLLDINVSKFTQRWGYNMEYELEEVERDYIEFRKEIGEE